MKVARGDVVKKETLIQNEWKQITSFGNDQIWGKGKNRIMWEPKTGMVGLTYSHK